MEQRLWINDDTALPVEATSPRRMEMERTQIDVSRLAELSTIALLSGKVRLSLRAFGKQRAINNVEARRVERGLKYLDRLLQGLDELSNAGSIVRLAGPTQLHAIDSYLIAAPALSQSALGRDAEQLESAALARARDFLALAKSTLTRVLNSEPGPPDPSHLSQVDSFFAALGEYAREEQAEMLSTPVP